MNIYSPEPLFYHVFPIRYLPCAPQMNRHHPGLNRQVAVDGPILPGDAHIAHLKKPIGSGFKRHADASLRMKL